MTKTWLAALVMAATVGDVKGADAAIGDVADSGGLLTVLVLNQAGVPDQILQRMYEDLETILRQAGVGVSFVPCPRSTDVPRPRVCSQPLSADRIVLQFLPGQPARRVHSVGTSTVDVETGAASIVVFAELAASIAKDSGWSWPELLAHLAGHEIGHVLLASKEHTRTGIMRAVWSTAELGMLRHPQAMFNSEQSKKMQKNLTARAMTARAVAGTH